LTIIGWVVVAMLKLGGTGHGRAETKSASKVRVELTEFRFNPSTVTLKAGVPVELELVNTGKDTHMLASPYLGSQDVEIEGSEIEVDAPNGIKYVKLEPGKSVEIKFTPKGKGKLVLQSFVWVGEGRYNGAKSILKEAWRRCATPNCTGSCWAWHRRGR